MCTCNDWCCERSVIKADVWIIVRSETRSSEQRPDVFKNVSEQARTGRTGRFVAALWSHFGQLTTINNYEERKKQREKSASTRVRELWSITDREMKRETETETETETEV